MRANPSALRELTRKLEGPIAVFGAGGFVGANLVRALVQFRDDVFAITSKPFVPWRLEEMDASRILQCDITSQEQVKRLFEEYRFMTVFDLAAYGAYSKQEDIQLIHRTNYLSLLHLLESALQVGTRAFVHAGSSSEYGLNCAGPSEDAPLQPNSHYAVSKAAAASMVHFYGTIRNLPVTNLRYYSIYGPYEEPDRLVPKLISEGLRGKYPPLVQPEISRDFVYVDDAIRATLLAAIHIEKVRGKSVNIASNRKTQLRELVAITQKLFSIPTEPSWGDMPNRKWDLVEWFGNANKAAALMEWTAETPLETGLQRTIDWQKTYARPLYERKLEQDSTTRKLSAVIACYRDAQAIPVMHKRLTETFRKIKVDYEIIFVNDCSPDNSQQVLAELLAKDPKIVVIEHSRNFGSQSAFLSGMELSTGDAVILLDGDLQDPPELIEEFHARWKEGHDVVYGRRVAREGSRILVTLYTLFYRVFRGVSYVPIPLDAGDFSLMDRRVVDQLVALPETDQFLRGLRAWVGFRQTGVDYVRPERMFGTTTNNLRKNIAWARKAIFSFSYVPLELLTYLGWTLTLLSFLAIILQIIAYFLKPGNPHGVTTIIVLVLFFGGLQMLGISVLGEYQAKLVEEAKRRPKYIRKNVYRRTP
jgi:nucleoside-diphosphate-sugar epimerase/glycosyltransferase involved in cell wall biosynthesis